MRKIIIMICLLPFLCGMAMADCTDYALALPGQTYILGDTGTTITFGESQVSGFCPSGIARIDFTECIDENGKSYCTDRTVPLNYQTTSGNPWLLIPNLAIGWLMDGKLYLVPINTPMMELESDTGAGPVPWGTW